MGKDIIYIFGYGSLIFPAGINGRGMAREYTRYDLVPARLRDFKRAWEALSPHNGKLYLGVSHVEGATVNGVVFKIDPEDLNPFMASELSTGKDPLYILKDVTSLADVSPDFKGRVCTCITRSPKQGVALPWYQERVEEGLQFRGNEFRDEFFRTTDWSGLKHSKIIRDWQPELLGPE